MAAIKLTRRAAIRAAVLAGTAVVAIGTVGMLALNGERRASAEPAPAPRLVEGNVTTCEEAGLSGTILFGEGDPEYPAPPEPAGTGTVSPDGILLTVTINEGFTASGIVVKGGPDTNVYDGPFVGPITVEDMHAPPVGNQTPQISHWFVCGEVTPSSPSPSPSVSESPSPSPSVSPSTSPSVSPSASPSVSPSPSRPPRPTPSRTKPPGYGGYGGYGS